MSKEIKPPTPSTTPAAKPPRFTLQRHIDIVAVRGQVSIGQDQKKSKNHLENERRQQRDIENRAAGLMAGSSSPLIETLSLTVALCEHELRARQLMNNPLSNFPDGQKNYDRAMRRYLAACKTLATVQKLEFPSLQVNIARNQVVQND